MPPISSLVEKHSLLSQSGVYNPKSLAAINASSGRSLQTEVRLPEEVLSRKFDYGFKLGLMLKDVRIAVDGVLSLSNSSEDSIFPIVERFLEKSSINEGTKQITRALCAHWSLLRASSYAKPALSLLCHRRLVM